METQAAIEARARKRTFAMDLHGEHKVVDNGTHIPSRDDKVFGDTIHILYAKGRLAKNELVSPELVFFYTNDSRRKLHTLSKGEVLEMIGREA